MHLNEGYKMKINLIAQLKKNKEFFDGFIEGDEKILYGGKSLLFYAIGKHDLESRYAICNFLIDKGIDVTLLNTEHASALHSLLGQNEHDLNETIKLCKRLIGAGVDINVLDSKNRLAIQEIINMAYNDDELRPLYDLWFSQPNIDCTTKNFMGYSPLDIIKERPNRKVLYERLFQNAGK